MDFKKTNAPTTTVTRNLVDLSAETGNIYESVAIIGKRANQIAAEMKEELKRKLEEFGTAKTRRIWHRQRRDTRGISQRRANHRVETL